MLTRALVDMVIQNNATWEDAFQFGDPDDAPDQLVATATANVAATLAAYAAANPSDINAAIAADDAAEKAAAAAVVVWDFIDKTFRLDVKAKRDDTVALLSLTTANGRIVVDDVVKRVLHFNVPDADIIAALPPGRYLYDLVMIDDSVPPVRVVLMGGSLAVVQGVTGD